jgi:hypothetical protein
MSFFGSVFRLNLDDAGMDTLAGSLVEPYGVATGGVMAYFTEYRLELTGMCGEGTVKAVPLAGLFDRRARTEDLPERRAGRVVHGMHHG